MRQQEVGAARGTEKNRRFYLRYFYVSIERGCLFLPLRFITRSSSA
jgi:hypothetical protein